MAKLFVICGHGAGDPGACGNGYQEAERVRVLGKRIKELGGDNVMLGGVNRNYYADNGISKLTIAKDYQLIELHMDNASATARGAHVIIDAGMNEDQYDIALAKFLTGLFPGRSQSIVKRNNLANPARALAAGYGYRLVECGFISNAEDVKIFNSNIDAIAKGILNCFSISSGNSNAATPQPSTPTSKLKYGVGTPVCVQKLSRSADGTAGVIASHYTGTITKVYEGQPYPYLLDGNAGFVNDAIIDADPHIPGQTASKPAASKPAASTIKVGDWVGVKVGAKDYNGNKAGGVVRGKVYYTVDELKGARAVLDIPGICTPFHLKDLFK